MEHSLHSFTDNSLLPALFHCLQSTACTASLPALLHCLHCFTACTASLRALLHCLPCFTACTTSLPTVHCLHCFTACTVSLPTVHFLNCFTANSSHPALLHCQQFTPALLHCLHYFTHCQQFTACTASLPALLYSLPTVHCPSVTQTREVNRVATRSQQSNHWRQRVLGLGHFQSTPGSRRQVFRIYGFIK